MTIDFVTLLPIFMFFTLAILLFSGFPVAFVLGGVGLGYGFLGMALGMSLLLIALQHADAGIVATLSSTSPIMILFLIWLVTKKIPTTGAWIGTILAIIGSSLIFIY